MPAHDPFAKALSLLLTDIFSAAFDSDICGFENTNQLATAAGLSWQTVDKLLNRSYQTLPRRSNPRIGRPTTNSPMLRTVWKLCRAVRMDLSLAQESLGLHTRKRSA